MVTTATRMRCWLNKRDTENEFYLASRRPGASAEIVKESVSKFIYATMNGHYRAPEYKTPDDVHQAFYRQKLVNPYQISQCIPKTGDENHRLKPDTKTPGAFLNRAVLAPEGARPGMAGRSSVAAS